VKRRKLARKHNFHGRPKGFTFKGPHQQQFGARSLYKDLGISGDGGNKMAKELPSPGRKGK
jgi:hypothetical protein